MKGLLRILLSTGATAGTVLAVLACATAPTPPATTGPRTPRLEMGDFYFKPSGLELAEGQKTFLTLVNRGTEKHELLLGRDILQVDGHPNGYRNPFLAGTKVLFTGEEFDWEYEGDLLEMEVMPGGEVTMEFTVPDGKNGLWEMGCFVPGHYEAGMSGQLLVSGS